MSSGAMGHVIKDRGVKIYVGQHTDASNCPPNRADYVGSDTTIICTTTIKEISTFHYEDHLINEKNSILLSANTNKSGEALDQSSTYPPDNPYSPTPIPEPTPCDAFDIGHPCP